MITVEGKIKGKARPRFNTRTGHAITPQDTVNYENWVKMCYKEQYGEYLEGALQAIIIAYYKIPPSYTKKRVQAIREGKEYPCKKPDGDNIAKIILDSLNKIAFDDDKQIIDLRVIKKFTEENERVEFEIKKITKEEE